MNNTQSPHTPISTEIGGKTYSGTFTVESKTVTVWTAMGHKTTQISGGSAATLARLMLGELVREGKA